jgi:hypothetical protein
MTAEKTWLTLKEAAAYGSVSISALSREAEGGVRRDLGAQGVLQHAIGFLPRQVEDQISDREKARPSDPQRSPRGEILGDHRLAEAVRRNDNHVVPLREKVQRQDALGAASLQRVVVEHTAR